METLDNVNKLFGDSLKETIQPGARLRIAAATFSIYAFEALKKELESIDSFEFLFTTPAFLPDDEQPKERREFHIPKKAQERLFYGSDFEIQLKNQLYQRAIARECADWIKRKARFRSNRTGAPMQEFACVQGRNIDVVYHPLQGFTKVGLGYEKGDAISNLMMRLEGEDITKSYLSTLDQIWSDPNKVEDVTERLREHIASVYRENDPERIYFLMLYSIFNEFLEDISEDVMPKDRTGYQDSVIWNMLFNFQRDAATGIINKLETYNGCILADSVGLGKTFSALAVIKYYETRNSRVLVLCPKKLAENWTTYTQNLTTNELEADRFNYDVLCHTDLQRDRGESLGMQLNRVNWGNYDLVVIDESHNFRNDDTYKDRETRYQRLMNKVIRAGITTKVLMLSATPVNNRFSDLRNQLALAYEGSEAKLDAKLKTERGIKEIFKRAQTAFTEWSKRAPDERTAEAILTSLDFDFFELLDSVTIARSRRHIQTFYDTSEIGAFPERLPPLSIHSDLTSRDDVIGFNDIFERLSGLRMAVYAPITYILPSRIAHYADLYDTKITGGDSRLRQADREKSLQRLMTVNLLKRLESSVHAFRLTLSSLARHHRATLDKIDAHKNLGDSVDLSDLTDALGDSEPDDDILDRFGDEEETIGSKVRINLADMDLTSFENDLNADLTVISELLAEMEKITPEHDAKLQRLMAEIDAKLASPLNPGNRKVLLFTAFADTADYLYANLHPHLETNHGLHTGKVTGKGAPASTLGRGYAFQELLTLFSPRSKKKDSVLPDEPSEIDLLIGTDCISEGQNLQDCDFLINYDIHWNPVRIIQRFGRIDRIGSTNSTIRMVNFWPNISLDEYINLKERVENRMVIADAVATADDNPLQHAVRDQAAENDISYRREQLRRLQDEVIELEDVKTGVSITDLGLNDFRMDLLNYLKGHPDITGLPNGLHAVVPAHPERGMPPGVLFVLRNRNHGVNIGQRNRLHPYYLLYIGEDGQIIADHTAVKRQLDLARAACKGKTQPISEVCQRFNAATDDGRDMEVYSDLLSQAIDTIVERQETSDIDSLFKGERTGALVNPVTGMEDFELINFLVFMSPDDQTPTRRAEAERRLKSIFANIPASISLADELIAAREKEAARESEDDEPNGQGGDTP